MGKEKLQQIEMLINNKLSEKESNELIAEIKNNKEMELEFALLMKLKQKSRQFLKQQLLDRMHSNSNGHPGFGPAATALGSIRSAAFSANKPSGAEDLPIDDETIEDFLNEQEELDE